MNEREFAEAARVARLAQKTQDAYSAARYGSKGWAACVRLLCERGYTDREAEAILRSKWMRWAADMGTEEYGHGNSADLARFLDDRRSGVTAASVRLLVEATFGEEAGR